MAAPAVGPYPGTILSTPGGKPAYTEQETINFTYALKIKHHEYKKKFTKFYKL